MQKKIVPALEPMAKSFIQDFLYEAAKEDGGLMGIERRSAVSYAILEHVKTLLECDEPELALAHARVGMAYLDEDLTTEAN